MFTNRFSLLVFLVLFSLAGGFYFGKTSLNVLVSNAIETAGKATKQSPTPLIISTPTSSPKSNPDMIESSGIFHFSDHQIKYIFTTHKAGGPISGSLEGVCQGSPTGKYEGGEGGKIEGTFQAQCSAGPLDLINVEIKAKRVNKSFDLPLGMSMEFSR